LIISNIILSVKIFLKPRDAQSDKNVILI
jgi:hypothetical protein